MLKMGCHASKNAVSAVDTVPARRRCRANLKLDTTISTDSSTSSSPRHSTCPPEDSLFEKLRLPSDESVCSSNNKASLSRHSDADTVLLTPVAVQSAVPGIVEETYLSSCPTGDLILDKPNLLSQVRDEATAVGDSTDDLSTGSEVESHGASENHSGEEIVSGSESEVYGEGERVEAAATGASTRVETEHRHGNGWLSDSDGKCAEANEAYVYPDGTSSPHKQSSLLYLPILWPSAVLRLLLGRILFNRLSRHVSFDLICLVGLPHLIFLTVSSYKWHRDKNSQGENRGEMGISFVTTAGRMAMLR